MQDRTAVSPTERETIRRKAEEHASDHAGPKMIQTSLQGIDYRPVVFPKASTATADTSLRQV